MTGRRYAVVGKSGHMMKRLSSLIVAVLCVAGCAAIKSMHSYHRNTNPYAQPIFYTRYLNPSSPLDAAIQRDIDALRVDPNNARLHNELGQYLAQRGFPKDAEKEFERAVDSDSRFWPAWYNLGLTRAARGDDVGARFAFNRTLHYKPGHSQALFQEGLMAESRGDNETAIEMYAKAISINHQLLDVKTNPRVLDSKLIHLALLRAYSKEHSREAVMFQATPPTYGARSVPAAEPAAPSPQAPADKIVTPAPPITNPATQTAPPNPRP